MLENPNVIMHMKEAEKIAKKIHPHLYEVSFVDEVPHSWCQPWTERIHNSSKTTPGKVRGPYPFEHYAGIPFSARPPATTREAEEKITQDSRQGFW